MADQLVKAGSTVRLGRVEGDLSVGKHTKIKAEGGGKIIVTGRAHFEGAATIDGDFECQSLRVEGRGFGPGGDIRINGNLTVEESANVDASARVTGSLRAGGLDVGGHLKSGPLSTTRLRVGGHIQTWGTLEAREVDIGGHMTVLGEVKIENLRVGGHTKIGGGSISGDIRIRGHFSSSKKLTFGRLETYGNLVLPEGSTGNRIAVYGRVEFEGESFCKELEVTGSTKIRGKLSFENVSLKGNLTSSGSIQVSKRLSVWGAADVGGTITCETLGVGGRLVAEGASATNRIDIAGEVRTSRGLKSLTLVVGRGSKVTGPIYAENAEIGSEADLGSVWGLPWWRGMLGRLTTVEDVHGGTVKIRSHSRAGHVFGKTVELEDGAMAEEIVYTDQIRLPSKYFLTKPPRKVEELPDQPT